MVLHGVTKFLHKFLCDQVCLLYFLTNQCEIVVVYAADESSI